MGYACPVCEAPQRDGEHLANHLAFTAMLRGEAHEDWLDEYVPDWEESGPAGLAERVAPFAEETDYEEVFEDTVGGHAHGGHAPGRTPVDTDLARDRGSGELDEDARATLEEARELTRQMVTDESEAADPDDRDE